MTNALNNILKQAKELSIISKHAWVLKESNGSYYFTDCDEITMNTTDKFIAEFFKGERLTTV